MVFCNHWSLVLCELLELSLRNNTGSNITSFIEVVGGAYSLRKSWVICTEVFDSLNSSYGGINFCCAVVQ